MDLESREAHWAVIRDGLVDSVVVWDGEADWTPPEGTVLESLADWPHVGIGWTYLDGDFVDNRPTEEPVE